MNRKSQSQRFVGYFLSLQMRTDEKIHSKLRGIKPIWSNKKIFFIPVILFLLEFVLAYNIGYVVNNPTNLENNEALIKNFLINKNHTVNIIDDSVTSVNSYSVVIVSDSVNSIKFDNKNYKVLFLSNKAAFKSGISKSYGTTSGRDISLDKIDTITEGYSLGNLNVYSSQDSLNYILSSFASNSKNLAYKTKKSRSVILALEKNSVLLDGRRTFERNAFFGITEAEKWNLDSMELLSRTITWLVKGGLVDDDNDGYYSVESGGDDCNDNDLDIHPGADDIKNNCVNDAPLITDYSPKNISKILSNYNYKFRVNVSDEDINNIEISWKIDDILVGDGFEYTFNKDQGVYKISAFVYDGEFTTKNEWNIEVKNSDLLNCSDIHGNICSDNQMCNEKEFSTADTKVCCLSQCSERPPLFSRIDVCENVDSNIGINLEDVEDLIYIGDGFNFTVKITNRLDKKKNFDIVNYLYDITEDDDVVRIENSADVNKGLSESFDFEMEIPKNINEENQFVLYTYVETNDACNKKYQKIKIERKFEEIIIKDFDFRDQKYICGDNVNVEVSLENIGLESRDVTVKIESPELEIDEKTEEFEIEGYGDDDSEIINLLVKIPDDAVSGEYPIRAEVNFNGKYISMDKSIILDECNEASIKEDILDTINILGSPLETFENVDNSITYFAIFYTFIIIFGMIILYFIFKRR